MRARLCPIDQLSERSPVPRLACLTASSKSRDPSSLWQTKIFRYAFTETCFVIGTKLIKKSLKAFVR